LSPDGRTGLEAFVNEPMLETDFEITFQKSTKAN